ncbi:uncharacterized protein LOC144153493 [Haemaphysalis longicornis]
MVQFLSGAVEALLTARKPIRRAIKLATPTYRGYGDLTSARDFLDSLAHYPEAMGLDDEEILTRIVPVALTETAARWYGLSGHRAANFGEFRAAFLREFLPVDYERRMRRELELRIQAREEFLQEFVRAIDELFAIAETHASNEECVERVIRQGHPSFSAYLRGCRFRDLEELAVEAKRIEGDILAARAYRQPPPASESLEPRCAWNGPLPLPRGQGTADPSAARFSSGSNEVWGLSERALDPYTYARRSASAAPAQQRRLMDRVLGEAKWSHAMCYLHDIVIYSRTFEEHVRHIADVLERVRAAVMTLNPAKAQIAQTRVSLLGFSLGGGSMEPDREKLRAMLEFPTPKDVRGLRRFLGMANFYRSFFPSCARVQVVAWGPRRLEGGAGSFRSARARRGRLAVRERAFRTPGAARAIRSGGAHRREEERGHEDLPARRAGKPACYVGARKRREQRQVHHGLPHDRVPQPFAGCTRWRRRERTSLCRAG